MNEMDMGDPDVDYDCFLPGIYQDYDVAQEEADLRNEIAIDSDFCDWTMVVSASTK
jgi:hypothetical protein